MYGVPCDGCMLVVRLCHDPCNSSLGLGVWVMYLIDKGR